MGLNNGLVENKLWAVAKVTGATAAFTMSRRFGAAGVHTGAGDILLTLEVQCDPLERITKVTPRTADIYAVVVDTSDTQIQVLTYNNAGAATDSDFDISVTRVVA